MSVITGTIRGVNLLKKSPRGQGAREEWAVSADFGSHTAGDTAGLSAVGAAITSRCRDGKTRTIRWAGTSEAGRDSQGASVYFTGTTLQALAVSTDDLTGHLGSLTGAVGGFSACTGVVISVACDVS